MKRMLNFLLSLILALTCISPVCVFADEKTAVKADEQAEGDGDGGRGDAYGQGVAGAVDDPGQQVPSEVVGAQ